MRMQTTQNPGAEAHGGFMRGPGQTGGQRRGAFHPPCKHSITNARRGSNTAPTNKKTPALAFKKRGCGRRRRPRRRRAGGETRVWAACCASWRAAGAGEAAGPAGRSQTVPAWNSRGCGWCLPGRAPWVSGGVGTWRTSLGLRGADGRRLEGSAPMKPQSRALVQFRSET